MKNTKGITLISLIIMVIVLVILASIATYSGIDIIKSSKFTAFSTELKIMQTQVNTIYQDKDKANIGEEITEGSSIKAKANKVFTANESGITSQEGYKYWSQQLIKELGIEGVEQDFFVNLEKRSVVSYEGFKYGGKTYYTLQQIPNGLYNVDYSNPNIGKPTFEVNIEKIENKKWRVTIPESSINYTIGYIDKWKVQYQLEGRDYWNTSEDLSFVVEEKGNYKIKIQNGTIISDEKIVSVGVTDISKIKIGDYVAYMPQRTTTSYTFESKYSGNGENQNINQDTNLKWRVLKVDENTVELISDIPTSTTVYFQGALGFNNAVYLLNDFCNILYGNTAKGAVARSLQIEDIEENINLSVWNYRDYGSQTEYEYGKARTYSINRYYPYQWTLEKTDKSKIDGNIITGVWEKSEQRVKTRETSTQASSSIEVQQIYWNRTDTEMKGNFQIADARDTTQATTMYYELLCNNGSSNYWLASRCVNTYNSSYAAFGLRGVIDGSVDGIAMFYSNSTTSSDNKYVRPVVSLPSDIINTNVEYDTGIGWEVK